MLMKPIAQMESDDNCELSISAVLSALKGCTIISMEIESTCHEDTLQIYVQNQSGQLLHMALDPIDYQNDRHGIWATVGSAEIRPVQN